MKNNYASFFNSPENLNFPLFSPGSGSSIFKLNISQVPTYSLPSVVVASKSIPLSPTLNSLRRSVILLPSSSIPKPENPIFKKPCTPELTFVRYFF